MKKELKKWYANWFNTDFYHILYQDRDYKEAERFMNTLTRYLKLSEHATVLDLACGKGRHAVYLNTLGYDVTGIDLSENSISFAKQFENETLHFDVHNMCIPYHKKFDAVFNLFTSFGYFDDDTDNFNTIKAIKANLNSSGIGVLDFMNVNHVIANLVPEDTKKVNGITFHQKRYLKEGYIFKDIDFRYKNEDFHFTERIKAITLDDFERYFEKAHIELLDIFGDYALRDFDLERSERLIFIFK